MKYPRFIKNYFFIAKFHFIINCVCLFDILTQLFSLKMACAECKEEIVNHNDSIECYGFCGHKFHFTCVAKDNTKATKRMVISYLLNIPNVCCFGFSTTWPKIWRAQFIKQIAGTSQAERNKRKTLQILDKNMCCNMFDVQ